ncbi:phage terminase large subunit [Phenylobacterium sp.]|uniref:phage terminase large subunit n=1 Tax=Phenylobacterium sp. TaxID=1871053 RepID=UPI00301C42E5
MTAPRPTPQVLRAALQADFHAFIRPAFDTLNPGQAFQPNWHIEAIAHALSEVGRGDINPLLITIPPRYLKSICGSVAFPAWMMGRDPTLRFLVASYSAELATKHARDFRTVVESGWFRTFFPNFGRLKRVADAEITTAQNGSRRSVSLGGSVTGFGADILIIDDLMKAADASSPVERQRVRDFYDQTLFSRLDDKQDGCIIAIQQRLHEDDLAGYLLEKGGNWVHLNLPAIAEEDEQIPLGPRRRHVRKRGDALFPSREPIGTLESIRLEIGAPAFSAQYQQNPVSLDSAHVRWERIQTYEEPYHRVAYTQVVQSWDTAMHGGPNSDFSVCTTWGYAEGAWWLLDLVRVRLDYPDLKARVLAEAHRWRADIILVEHAGTGIPLLYDLMAIVRSPPLALRGRTWMPRAYQPRTDKLTRLAAQVAKLEEGRARFPSSAPWLLELKRELLGFPQAKYDDQVDSVSQFLEMFGNSEPHTGRPYVRRRQSMRAAD